MLLARSLGAVECEPTADGSIIEFDEGSANSDASSVDMHTC